MEKQKTENDLSKCMKTLLKSVDHNIQSGTISLVAEEHQNSSNQEAYIPRVVSMGPRYNKFKEELLHMEEIKLRCMLSLFHRAAKDGNIEEITEKCNSAIWKLDDKIQASYVMDIGLERYELAKIMLVDGCFLLELLITKAFELNSQLLPNHLNVTSIHSPFPRQVLKNDVVLSDLTLLENQIPMFIVRKLSKILFPYFSGKDSKETYTIFNKLALSILGYSYQLSQVQSLEIKFHHLLDVVHYFVNNNNNNNSNNPEHRVKIMHNSTETQRVKETTKLKLKCCATRLEVAGVSIHQLAQDKGVGGLDFEFKFKEGKLEIAALIITETTKAKWRNVIAWEHHKMDWKKSYSNKSTNGSEIYSTCGKFTSAALIFNDLICCRDDVKLLKDKNIIVDHTKMSNKELEEFIRTMSFGVDHGIVGSGYVEMVRGLNDYTAGFHFKRFWKKLIHYFTYCYEWCIKFMKKKYHFVATVISLCTVVQTIYAIIAYQLPK
ncbi:hypothetical protein TSUD_177670 [Trifolium subterraneum]|uniref:DUF247 domain protein n=1 Tax=Trifolium subterraneum TaxID=3900 RepID=A0A2Z6PU60_TRISU|nr:hypothetical protein TSUD_177670 [Trifolium subterraneum]